MPRPHRQGTEEFDSIEIVEGPTPCYCDDFSQLRFDEIVFKNAF